MKKTCIKALRCTLQFPSILRYLPNESNKPFVEYESSWNKPRAHSNFAVSHNSTVSYTYYVPISSEVRKYVLLLSQQRVVRYNTMASYVNIDGFRVKMMRMCSIHYYYNNLCTKPIKHYNSDH